MKDDAVIKDNEAVYLLNEQTYLHLRENLAGVGYEVFDKNSPLPVEEGQIPREVLGNTQRRIETARAYYLAEHQDEPVGRIQNVAVTTLEKFRSGVRKRRNLAPRSLPENDVRFIDPMYNELFRVPDGSVVQMTYPDGHQRSEVVEYLDDYHMKIGSTVQHICEFAERMARSRGIVEPEPLTQQEQRAWNLEYDYYLTVQADNGSWNYALYQGDCCLLERGKIDAPELMIEEVRDEILYSHNLRNKDCIPLTQEEFVQKLADRNEIQSYRMKQFQQSGHDCYLVMQLQQDADPALRFAAMRYLNKQNIAPSIENYEILYRGNLPEGKRSVLQAELLEQLECSKSNLLEEMRRKDLDAAKKEATRWKEEVKTKVDEQDALKKEMIRVIQGISGLDREMIQQMVNENKEALLIAQTNLADSEKKLKEIEEQNQKAERNCSDLFTWASTYKGASFERRQAILKQFIKEVRVGRDYNIEIVLNVPLDEFEEFKRHAASAGRGKNQKNKSQNPQKVGRCTSNAGIVVLDKTAGETISIVPKNAAHAILRC